MNYKHLENQLKKAAPQMDQKTADVLTHKVLRMYSEKVFSKPKAFNLLLAPLKMSNE